nr:hypothetical protein [Tanacetum cinerariifolium]
ARGLGTLWGRVVEGGRKSWVMARGPETLWGRVVEGGRKSWVVVGRQENREKWCYRNSGKKG